MRYLVSGGAGFIGHHLANRLTDLGHEVVVFDNLSAENNLKHLKKAVFWNGDIRNRTELILLFSSYAFDGVFHLAAKSRIQPSIEDPETTVDTNVYGTLNLLETMRQFTVKNIVYSASSSSYGLKNRAPLFETMSPDCLTPYAASKLMGEELCKTWAHCYDIHATCLKYFNVYGPRSPTTIGGYSPVVGLFLKQALIEKKPMTVIGDGNQKRDFTFINDIVHANVFAMNDLNSSESECNRQTVNIGTGKNISIKNLANLIQKILLLRNVESSIEFIEPRPCEAHETCADTTLCKEVFGWSPLIDVELGIDVLLKHYDKTGEL